MNKDEFFKKIKEAESYYNKNNPCYHCGPGNGCDDCRDCKDSKISHEMWQEVYNLKNEYKEKFGVDYNKEVEALDKLYREQVRKRQLLKEVWETCTFDEIIDSGFDCGKCSGLQLVEAANEFNHKDKRPEDNCIDDLREVLESYSKSDLPWGRDVMELMAEYFHEDSMMDYFDNDDLIDHLDGTWEMDDYLKENQLTSDDKDNEEYTFKDFQKEVDELPNWKFRRLICDWLMCNYFTGDDELINKLKNRIK